MHEIMTAADIIFSKAGGLTVSECMAKGLPMIINKVIPGQEEDNTNFLVDHGAAIKVNNYSEVAAVVIELANKPEEIEKMKKASQTIGRPDSAIDIADFIYKKIT